MAAPGEMQLQKTAEDSLTLVLAGSWKLGQELPSTDVVRHELEGMPGIGNIAFDTRELADWDSGLLIFLVDLREFCTQQKIPIDDSGLPQGAQKLLALAAAVPAKKMPARPRARCRF